MYLLRHNQQKTGVDGNCERFLNRLLLLGDKTGQVKAETREIFKTELCVRESIDVQRNVVVGLLNFAPNIGKTLFEVSVDLRLAQLCLLQLFGHRDPCKKYVMN